MLHGRLVGLAGWLAGWLCCQPFSDCPYRVLAQVSFSFLAGRGTPQQRGSPDNVGGPPEELDLFDLEAGGGGGGSGGRGNNHTNNRERASTGEEQMHAMSIMIAKASVACDVATDLPTLVLPARCLAVDGSTPLLAAGGAARVYRATLLQPIRPPPPPGRSRASSTTFGAGSGAATTATDTATQAETATATATATASTTATSRIRAVDDSSAQLSVAVADDRANANSSNADNSNGHRSVLPDHVAAGTEVALKEAFSVIMTADVAAFAKELAFFAALRHQHIVPFYGIHIQPGKGVTEHGR